MAKASISIVFCLSLLCSACVTTSNELATEKTKQTANKANVSSSQQNTAKVEIVLLADPDPAYRKRANDIEQGAKLAQQDLGDGKLSVIVRNINETTTSLDENSKQTGNLSIILDSKQKNAGSFTRPYPIIAINSNDAPRSSNTFAFLPSETDSLIAGIKHALNEKPGPIALITPPQYSSVKISQIKKEVGEQYKLNNVEYTANETLWQAAKRAVQTEKNTTIFAFVGNDQKIEPLAKSIRSLKGSGQNYSIVGNNSWSSSLFRSPSLDSAIVAKLDKNNSKIIASRYQQKYGASLTNDALYGYDVIAIAAGIVRSKGIQALNKSSILDSSGFSGVTGTFRFRADGSIERIYKINQIKKSQLIPIETNEKGFSTER